MASLDKFLQDQGYTFRHTDKEVVLEKSKKISIISFLVGIVGISVFVFLGYTFKSAGVLFYIIAVIIFLLVWRFNFRGFRPIIIFDWTYKTMVRKSVYFFINSKTTLIEGYQGIDVSVVDLATSSSEGVDEFQKTVYLKTSNGDVNVVDFYTDFEPVEPEIPLVMEVIDAHLKKASK